MMNLQLRTVGLGLMLGANIGTAINGKQYDRGIYTLAQLGALGLIFFGDRDNKQWPSDAAQYLSATHLPSALLGVCVGAATAVMGAYDA